MCKILFFFIPFYLVSCQSSLKENTLRSLSSNSSVCRLTKNEKEALEGFKKIYENKLWQDYPSTVVYALKSEAVDSKPYFYHPTIKYKFNELIGSCEGTDFGYIKGVKIKTEDDDKHISCSEKSHPDLDVCSKYKTLQSLHKKTTFHISLDSINTERYEGIQEILFGKKIWSKTEVVLYNSAHEMFHDYQYTNFKVIEETFQCPEVKLKSYRASEAVWWKTKLNDIYKASRKSILEEIARELIKKRTAFAETKDGEYCLKDYNESERHEGTAHYVGNKALLAAGSVTLDKLIEHERLFLNIPQDKFSMGSLYAIGASITSLVESLSLNNNWQKEIRAGRSQYDVLKSLVEL